MKLLRHTVCKEPIDIITSPHGSGATQLERRPRQPDSRSACVFLVLTRPSIQVASEKEQHPPPRYLRRPASLLRCSSLTDSFEWSKSLCFRQEWGRALTVRRPFLLWRSDGSVSQLSVRPLLWPCDVSIHHRAQAASVRLRAEGDPRSATLCGKCGNWKRCMSIGGLQ